MNNKCGSGRPPRKRTHNIITRHQSERYAGQPNELPVSDLPTYKQIIQYAYKVENEITTTEKIDSPAVVLKVIIAAERSKASKHKNSVCWLENNLLKLFDISACRCELPLLNCDDRNVRCKGCSNKHYVCLCEKSKQVPVLEREYLKDQKVKQGPFGTWQIGRIDKKETAMTARKRNKEKINMKSDTTLHSDNDYISETDMEIDNDDDYKKQNCEFFAKPLCEKNYTDLTNIAKAAIRFQVSDAATSAIATATLIDYQIITQNDRSQIITEKDI
ncbi:uncharacterized protein LOC136072531 [Hydra vulgaris]|uniref:uncharacterized protein LOC136072531 n=1 Tax=Hydra vulgaris TaxID=6087 RepID=UPI0032E9D2F9